ncbi:hypothetical protein EYZ11_012416 [Aspergillus tanneri]|uniref:Uncharacterized protein n=1 Tax=Aspergillus tanneri TaxID=1220188 RepID=A0A4S3J2E4_9EURO|nr:hypothetical protein EYZ11_012416 [Aspergillus tanneri]
MTCLRQPYELKCRYRLDYGQFGQEVR